MVNHITTPWRKSCRLFSVSLSVSSTSAFLHFKIIWKFVQKLKIEKQTEFNYFNYFNCKNMSCPIFKICQYEICIWYIHMCISYLTFEKSKIQKNKNQKISNILWQPQNVSQIAGEDMFLGNSIRSALSLQYVCGSSICLTTDGSILLALAYVCCKIG